MQKFIPAKIIKNIKTRKIFNQNINQNIVENVTCESSFPIFFKSQTKLSLKVFSNLIGDNYS